MDSMKNEVIKTPNILINFDFEEVNSAVLRNAQIWKLKKNMKGTRDVFVFSPAEFSHLYFHADKIFAFKNRKNPEYKKILEYKPDITLYFRVLSRIYSLALTLFQSNRIRKFIYSKIYFSARQSKFLIESGLEEIILNKIERIYDFEYIRVADYMDCSTFTVIEGDLNKWFKITFGYLAEMIASGDVYLTPKNETSIKMKKYSCLSFFYSSKKPKLVLRTRNFKHKATIHNSKVTQLTPLVEQLLKKGFFVLNIGTPAMPLDIHKGDYVELGHNMSIEEELMVCGAADACIMTAEAGLFTAFAATDLPLIQYDEEWSVDYIGVSLFLARRKAGYQDLDIRAEIESEDFEKASSLIANYTTSKKGVQSSESRFLPMIVDLGEI